MNFEIGQIFENTYPPEAALWCNQHGGCLIEPTYIDGKRVFQIIAIPAPSLEQLKTDKLKQLSDAHLEAEANAHLLSSVGFEIDANDRANRDINGLLITMSENDTVVFCDYNNEMREVTYAQLKTMLKEIIQNAQYIYAQKWMYRDAIVNADSVEVLEAIKINFEYVVSFIEEASSEQDTETVETV